MRHKLVLIVTALLFYSLPQASSAHMPHVEIHQTSGLEFWLSPQHQLPMIEVQMVIKGAGFITDPYGKKGRAALAAAMLSEGAGQLDAQGFARALEEKAINIHVDLGRDNLTISMQTLSHYRREAFELLANLVRYARFDEEVIEKQKRQMQVERARLEESPVYLAQRAFMQKAYGTHPYASARLGTLDDVELISKEDLQDYRRRHFAKDALLISIAGDISAADAAKLISGYFSDMDPNARPQKPSAPVPDFKPFNVALAKQLPQSQILFARPALSRDDPDFYAASLLNHIMGGGALTSRLGLALRQERSLTYGVNTALAPGQHANHWFGYFATQNETVPEALAVVQQVLADLHARGVSADELQKAKDYEIGSFPLKLDSNAAIASYLSAMQLYKLGEDYLQKRNDYFKDVSLQQVNRLARQWLAPQAWSWVRVGETK